MPDDPYVYPGTSVLRNRFGVRDAGELARREHDASSADPRAAVEPLPGATTWRTCRRFTARSSATCTQWAGELRTVAIAKDEHDVRPAGAHRALPLRRAGRPAARELPARPAGRPVADRLRYYLAEINAVHPFREGNGRTQRAFVGQLAAQAGYHLAWEQLTPERNIEASVAAMRGDTAPLRQALGELMSPAARGGRDPRAASFPRPPPTPHGARPRRRSAGAPRRPGASRASSAKPAARSQRRLVARRGRRYPSQGWQPWRAAGGRGYRPRTRRGHATQRRA